MSFLYRLSIDAIYVITIGSFIILVLSLPVIISKRTSESQLKNCSKPILIIFCITFLVLTPIQLFVSVVEKPLPEEIYTTTVKYTVLGSYDDFSPSYGYRETEVHEQGLAPFSVYVLPYQTDDALHGYYPWSVSLDCFDNLEFFLDDMLDNLEGKTNYDYETEIDYNGHTFRLTLHIDDLSDKALGYTLDDRFASISPLMIVFRVVLMIINIMGIISFFVASRKLKAGGSR